MGAMLVYYSFKVAVGLAVFYLAYIFILDRGLEHRLKRYFLLTAMFLSLSLPVVVSFMGMRINTASPELMKMVEILSFKPEMARPTVIEAVKVVAENGLSADASQHEAQGPFWHSIYFIGMGITGLLFLLRLLYFRWRFIRNRIAEKQKGFNLVHLKEKIAPFSFFGWIFINPDLYSREEYEQIVAHEKAHVLSRHSWDIALVELLVIMQWFNPFIYFYRRSLRELHEFQADSAVVHNTKFNVPDYAGLLFSQLKYSSFDGMANSFSYSLSKKRLKMLTHTNSTRKSFYKYLVFVPVFAGLLVFYACTDSAVEAPEVSDEFIEETKNAADGNLLAAFKFEYAAKQELKENLVLTGGKTYVFYVEPASGENPVFKIRNTEGEELHFSEITMEGKGISYYLPVKEDVFIEMMVKGRSGEKGASALVLSTLPYDENDVEVISISAGETKKEQVSSTLPENTFFVVEDMPKFNGKDQHAFRNYIQEEVKYPEIAAEKGIQGRVFVQFIVTAEGKVDNVNVIRGVDPILDKEAKRVVSSSPDWTPGMQRGRKVNVAFTFPIVFELE